VKILYHHRIASKDGQYVHVEELTEALKQLGHEIIMVCPGITQSSGFGSEGGLVPLLKKFIPGFIYELLELSYAFYAYFKLSKAVKRHEPDCLYERYNLYSPAGVWIKRRYNLPMLLEVNAPIFKERSKYNGISIPWLAKWSERYSWTGADIVLPVTRVLATYVLEAGVDESCVVVIPNGIDLKKLQNLPDNMAAKKRLSLEQRQVLGFTGFVREWHGMERVVELLAKYKNENWHLLLVGDGPARESIEQKAKDLQMSDYVSITGVIPREEVMNYIMAFDVALQPDVVSYASPLKLFEYLALGRAVVAPDSENIREILRNNVDALLFDQNDEGAFIRSVEELCGNTDLRNRLGDAGKSTINDKGLTWENNARRVVGLFKKLAISQ